MCIIFHYNKILENCGSVVDIFSDIIFFENHFFQSINIITIIAHIIAFIRDFYSFQTRFHFSMLYSVICLIAILFVIYSLMMTSQHRQNSEQDQELSQHLEIVEQPSQPPQQQIQPPQHSGEPMPAKISTSQPAVLSYFTKGPTAVLESHMVPGLRLVPFQQGIITKKLRENSIPQKKSSVDSTSLPHLSQQQKEHEKEPLKKVRPLGKKQQQKKTPKRKIMKKMMVDLDRTQIKTPKKPTQNHKQHHTQTNVLNLIESKEYIDLSEHISKMLLELGHPQSTFLSPLKSKRLLVTEGLMLSESPTTEIITFSDVLKNLDDAPIGRLLPSNAMIRMTNPFIGYDYTTAEDLYIRGMAVLLVSRFDKKEDAEIALKVLVCRAFKGVSVTCNRKTTDYAEYRCTRCKPEVISNESVREYFGDKVSFKNPSCIWKAILVKDPTKQSFFFCYVDSLSSHIPFCFAHKPKLTFNLLEAVNKEKNPKGSLGGIQYLLKTKASINITPRNISRHDFHLMGTISARATNEYIKLYNSLDNSIAELEDDIKSVLGILHFIKNNIDEGFEYEYELSNQGRFDYLAFMTSAQKEDIALFGDLLFIDSTFSVCNDGYKLINVVLIGNKYNSLLAATAFVRHEYASNYEKVLKFIDKNVPAPKKIPMTLISDCAPQIHSAMSKIHPYAVHIHCAFHLLKDEKLFQNCNTVTEEHKEEIRKYAYTAILSSSQVYVENAIAQLCKYANIYPELRGRLMYIVCQSKNGARPNQKTFSGNTVSSSRVESLNSVIKKAGLNSDISLLESISILYGVISRQHDYEITVSYKDWLYIKDKNFCYNFDTRNIIVSDDILELMYHQFLLACGNVYEVKDKSETEFCVTYKGNNLEKHNEFIVKLTIKGLNCRCSVKMGYPCRHMFAVVIDRQIKIDFNYFDVRFNLRPDKSKIVDSNKKAEAYLMDILDSKEDSFISPRRIAGVLYNKRNGIDVVAAFKETMKRYNGGTNTQEEANAESINNPNKISNETQKESPNDTQANNIDDEIEWINKEFGSVDEESLYKTQERYICPEASRSPDLDDEKREVAEIRAKNNLSPIEPLNDKTDVIIKKVSDLRRLPKNEQEAEEEINDIEKYDDIELSNRIVQLGYEASKRSRESMEQIAKTLLTSLSKNDDESSELPHKKNKADDDVTANKLKDEVTVVDSPVIDDKKKDKDGRIDENDEIHTIKK